jgi:hypothetical protein
MGWLYGMGLHEQHGNQGGPMSTDNLFPDPGPKRKRLQEQVLEYLRAGHTITEEIYRNELGGSSISAVLHNLKIRKLYEPGEFLVRDKTLDSTGVWVASYRLAKEAPVSIEDIPDEEHPEPLGHPEDGGFKEDAEDIVFEQSPPEVESIMVGVKGFQPELIIMFKGDFRPLRHVMTPTEVRYLITNLMAFVNMPKEEF